MPTRPASAADPKPAREARRHGSRPEQPASPHRLVDVNEAAALLAVKPATLYQWAYQRRFPS
jgi:hypothetical protein